MAKGSRKPAGATNGHANGHSDEAATAAERPNFTDEQRQEMIRELVPLKNRIEEASSAYQACFKKWKNLGAPSMKATSKIIAERRLDPDEVMAELRELTRMRAVTGRFPTIQQDMMEMLGAPISVTEKAQAEHNEFRAYDDGYFAGRGGQARDDNPYPPDAPDSPFFAKWDEGYLAGQAAIADEMGGGTKPANQTRRRRAPSAEDRPAGTA